jgi:hypothetical protein
MKTAGKCRRAVNPDLCPVVLRSPLGEVPDLVCGPPVNPYTIGLAAQGFHRRHQTIPNVFKSGISRVVHSLDLPGDGKVGNGDSVSVRYSVQHYAKLVRLCLGRGPSLLKLFSTRAVGMYD